MRSGHTDSRRITRERKTIRVMIGMYCRAHHRSGTDGLCAGCRQLHDFAMLRIDKCPFRSEKPTCVNCPIHCYQPAMRERIRDVMRYAGPRMIRRHPLLAILHIIDGRRRAELPPRRRTATHDAGESTGRRSCSALPRAGGEASPGKRHPSPRPAAARLLPLGALEGEEGARPAG